MEEKRKYLEYFDGAFDSTVAEKIKPENKPYVAYSRIDGIAYTVISKEPTSAYQMVDLGLPSGLKWADRNVGAETPQDNGLYFDWGNVEGHAVDENGDVIDGYSFDKNTYSTTLGGQYKGSTLNAEHDAATANMGGEWRMPTSAEILELIENTDQYYIDEDGSILTRSELDDSKLRSICFVKQSEAFDYGNRSNFIEIPFAGCCRGSLLVEHGVGVSCSGYVWSSSVLDKRAKSAYDLYFSSVGSILSSSGSSYVGKSVRGVHA